MKNLLLTFGFCLFSLVALKAQGVACNANVQLSLDLTGTATITPDMLTDGDISGLNLEVSLNHPVIQNFVLIPFAPTIEVNCDFVGNYTFEVRDLDTGISCWGSISIEDVLQVCPTEFGPDTYSLYYELKNANTLIDTDVELNGNPVNQVYDWLDTISYTDMIPGENTLSFPASNEQFPMLSMTALDILELVKMFYESDVEFPLRAVVMDVDGSGYLGVNDIIECRNIILGITASLPGKDFLFISETYEFPTDFDAFDFTNLNFREYKFDRDLVTKADLKFNAYKLGNIRDGGQWAVSDSLGGDPSVSSRGMRSLSINNREVQTGEVIDVPFVIESDGSDIKAMQLGIQFDGLELLNVSTNYTSESFAYNHLSNDDLRFLYTSPSSSEFEMVLQFEVKENGMISDFISLNNNFDQIVANYDDHNTIDLVFNSFSSTQEVMDLSTTIVADRLTINMKQGHTSPIVVSDVNGRTLRTLAVRNNQVTIDRNLFTHEGIYFISTISEGRVVSKKIVVI